MTILHQCQPKVNQLWTIFVCRRTYITLLKLQRNQNTIMVYLVKKNRIPDHAVLTISLTVSGTSVDENDHHSNSYLCAGTKYKHHKILNDFEICRETQCEIDTIYSDFCDIMLKEMDGSVPRYTTLRWTNMTGPLCVIKKRNFLNVWVITSVSNFQVNKRHDNCFAKDTFDSYAKQNGSIHKLTNWVHESRHGSYRSYRSYQCINEL